MAKTIPQLTDATTVNAADELIIQQGGITKRATAGELSFSLNTFSGIAHVKDFGAIGDGATDDMAAIQAAVNSGATVVHFDGSKTYALNPSTGLLVVPSGVSWKTSGCRFKLLNYPFGNRCIQFQGNCDIDSIHVVIDAGADVRRPIGIFGGNVSVGKVSIVSADQQNMQGNSFNNALLVWADNVSIKQVTIKNFDAGLQIMDCSNVRVDLLDIESYVSGVRIGSQGTTSNVFLNGGKMYGASPNTSRTPGYNGINIQNANNIHVSNMTIKDAGEHGIYLTSGEMTQRGIYYENLYIENTGGAGIKFRPLHKDGHPFAFTVQNVFVNNVQLVDCANTGSAATATTLNPCILAERVTNAKFSNIICQNRVKSFCAVNGIRISGCNTISFDNIAVTNPKEEAVKVVSANVYTDTADPVYYPVFSHDLNEIRVTGSSDSFSSVLFDITSTTDSPVSMSGNTVDVITSSCKHAVEVVNTGGHSTITGFNEIHVFPQSAPAVSPIGGIVSGTRRRFATSSGTKVYYGHVLSDGSAARMPPGMSVTNDSTGTYTITHNLNKPHTQLGIMAIPFNSFCNARLAAGQTDNTAIVRLEHNTTGADTDSAFYFMIAVDLH